MPEISIIVPVYKVEKYLDTCVRSILEQTFADFELILVDDGSPDRCGALCDAYAAEDERIIVIHKENGGLSSARNAGIEAARGNYIGFVDSDDSIAPDMYHFLYENMKKEQADLSMCGLFDVYAGREPKRLPEYYRVMGPEEAVEMVLKAEIVSVTAVNKLYKKEIFCKLRFMEGRQAEDAFAAVDILMNCKKIVVSSRQKYYYVHRGGSITTGKFSERDMDVIEAYQYNYGLVARHYPRLLPVARMRICWAHFWVLDKWLAAGEAELPGQHLKEMVAYLRGNTGFILRRPEFTRMRKLSFLILLFHFKLYKIAVLQKRKREPIYE
ncbi:glycosyltransferase [Clostridiaceae bacterium]|nr:glycosyltransferase [Clostridiaceae bacterium]